MLRQFGRGAGAVRAYGGAVEGGGRGRIVHTPKMTRPAQVGKVHEVRYSPGIRPVFTRCSPSIPRAFDRRLWAGSNLAMTSLIQPGPKPLTPWRRGVGMLLDAVLAPQCLSCGAITEGTAAGGAGALCGDCWREVTFVSAPMCALCGYPFELGSGVQGAASLCGACVRHAPVFARARAVFTYDAESRGLILGFKHADKTHGAPAYAQWMARVGSALLSESDLIVPVPLHRWRLFARRYNQAALLAGSLARDGGKAFVPDLLIRTRSTPPQGRLSRRARLLNVRGAFAVNARRVEGLKGHRVLLVDDVYTTGATVDAAARVLLAGGATAVDVLTLARVVRPA
jgi:ComF family protein